MTDGFAALNWIPFSSHSGASARAYELHRRLQDRFQLIAFVTASFPDDYRIGLGSVRFVEVGSGRTSAIRLREASHTWWRGLVGEGCRLWVTDTLPLIRFCEAASVITVHDLRHTAGRNMVTARRRLLMNLSMRRSIKRADAVIAVSRWGAEKISEYAGLPEGRLRVIPNAAGSMPDPKAVSTGIEGPYILAVGHLEERKNLGCLVEAFSMISDRWPGSLVLAGSDRGCGATLKAKASEFGLSERVIITGPVEPLKLAALYEHCALLACPSLYEGFGMTLLEGMSAGRPVIASDIPPHREVAGGAAIMVGTGPGMSVRFSAAMMDLLEDAGVSYRYSSAGRKRALDYSWDRSAELLGGLYDELMNTSAGTWR